MRGMDLAQKIVTGGLVGITVFGALNILSMYSYKKKRNQRADNMLEEITQIDNN